MRSTHRELSIAFGLQGGGTGKTTVSFNVALAMAERGIRVFFISMDMGRQSAVHLWNRRCLPLILRGEMKSVKDYMDGDVSDPLSIAYESNFLGVEDFFFVPGGVRKEKEGDPAKKLKKCTERFSELVRGLRKYGLVVIDSPGSGGLSSLLDYLMIMSSSDYFVPVVEPNESSMENCERLVNLAALTDTDVRALVINKFVDHYDEVERAEEMLSSGGRVFTVRRSDLFMECYRRGIPLLLEHPDSDEASDIRRIADYLCRLRPTSADLGVGRLRTALDVIRGEDVGSNDRIVLRTGRGNLFKRIRSLLGRSKQRDEFVRLEEQ